MAGRISRARMALIRLVRTRGSFRKVFLESGTSGEVVLADLADYCGAFDTSVKSGEGEHAVFVREGRRQVWLHIQEIMNLSDHRIALLQREVASPEENDDVD
jgi:hypothetical protein